MQTTLSPHFALHLKGAGWTLTDSENLIFANSDMDNYTIKQPRPSFFAEIQMAFKSDNLDAAIKCFYKRVFWNQRTYNLDLYEAWDNEEEVIQLLKQKYPDSQVQQILHSDLLTLALVQFENEFSSL